VVITIIAHFEAHSPLLGAFWHFEDPWGATGDPKPKFLSLYVYCVVLVGVYLFQAILGLIHLDLNGNNKV
jgi:hypothetical protein